RLLAALDAAALALGGRGRRLAACRHLALGGLWLRGLRRGGLLGGGGRGLGGGLLRSCGLLGFLFGHGQRVRMERRDLRVKPTAGPATLGFFTVERGKKPHADHKKSGRKRE